ncbi:AAA family ATPase [Rhizobium sp. TRM95796]|uniref:AAA family ATPase n=1 Tax=Rhizobium sp. TRM95796 TaxID=2979862 RepID=UPI0021E7015F|nr:ATP-binding protein [Rhizobium sp. TRM95796]MCV3768734.1 ATP-binding protein [Rhizobium sp. TRM95796]
MTLEARLQRYLLACLRRDAVRKLYRRAESAGLLEARLVDPANEASAQLWSLTARGQALIEQDRAQSQTKPLSRFGRALNRGSERIDPLRLDDDDGIATINHTPVSAASRGDEDKAALTPSPLRSSTLAAIHTYLPSLPIADVTVALLVARALAKPGLDLQMLFEMLARPDPFIVLGVPVPGFERLCADMLERQFILSQTLTLVDALPGQRLTRHYRDNPRDRGRVLAFSGTYMREKAETELKDAVTKALLNSTTPVLVLDESEVRELPGRLLAAADLVVEGQGVTPELIADVMQISLGIDRETGLAAMHAVEFTPGYLGIADLVAALRPGRSAEQIVGALERLDLANWAAAEESKKDKERNDTGKSGAGGASGQGKKSGKAHARYDLVQPVASATSNPNANAGNGKWTEKILLVEDLVGYGAARDWALDLRSDLHLWREGHLDWSEMSTKLLLSGPPGTGKTTFAKALCNTLQAPLLATSVSQWLEASYLGDVMTAMSATFEAAAKLRPAILFVDEIDGIGRRGAGGPHSDYWDTLVNRALELLDGAGKTEGVIVVGATNSPDKIDPALRRSGRLETHIDIPLPDTEALIGILAHHLGGDLKAVITSRPKPASSTVQAVASLSVGREPPVNSKNAGATASGTEEPRA